MKSGGPAHYTIKRFAAYRSFWWKDAEEANLDCFPWGPLAGDDYRPATSARAGTDGESLFLYMESAETGLRIETRGFGRVHTDSCMEFFLAPCPAASPEYLNFEFNPAGAMYLALGASRHGRLKLPEENHMAFFAVKTVIHGGGWNLEYRVPLSFLRRFFPGAELGPGTLMRGNFYKCGDSTARPHFGCWAPIDLPKPDFHCPEFFGNLETG